MGLLTRIDAFLKSSYLPPTPRADPGPDQVRLAPMPYPSYEVGRARWPATNQRLLAGYYEQVVIAFACVNLLADLAAAAKVRLYAVDDPETPLDDEPLRQLMATPNSYMSESEFLNCMVKVAAVSGFAVAEKERSQAGIIGLHPLRSDWLKAIPRRNNITDWEYKLPSGETYRLQGEDVVAWTYQGSPGMGATGISPLIAASRELAIENAMVNFTKAFFDGGGVPMTGLVVDENVKLKPAEAAELKVRYDQLRAEPWQPIILQTIRDVRRLGMDLNEMAYKDLRGLTAAQIGTAFRIPQVMLQTLIGLENSPWSKYEEARKSCYEDTIVPLWSRLDGAFTRALIPEFYPNGGVTLEFDTSQIPAFQEDDTADWTKITLPGIEKAFTINERRALVGYPPLVGGDVRLLSLADMEIGDSEAAQPSAERSIPTLREMPTPALASGRIQTRAAIGAKNKQRIVSLGDKMAPWMRSFFQQQGQRILEQLGLSGGRADVTLHLLLESRADAVDWEEEARYLAQEFARMHTFVGEAAFKDVSTQLSTTITFDLANPNVSRILDQLGTRIVGVTQQTRTDVARVIDAALSEGATIQELKDQVTGLFEETYKGRSETIARTESQVAYNSASALGYEESGLVDRAELFDNPNHDEDYGALDGLSCAQRNGLIVPLEDVGLHIEAEHPNGTLALGPVLKGED